MCFSRFACCALALPLLLHAAVETKPLTSGSDNQPGFETFYLTLVDAVFQGDPAGEISPKPLQVILTWQNGAWNSAAAVTAPGLNRAGHSGSLINQTSREAISLLANIGSDPWVPGDAKASYQLTLATEGDSVSGSYTGRFRGRDVHGDLKGSILSPGWYQTPVTNGVATLSFNLGHGLKNWNNAGWRPYVLPEPTDLSAWNGIQFTVETDTPRHDAWVDVGFMEEDGSWYYLRDAAPLSQARQTVTVDFDDLRSAEFLFNAEGTGTGTEGNFDEDFFLDRTRIARIAFGHVNGNGPGRVTFRIKDLEAARWRPVSPPPVSIAVTGNTLAVNGQEEIPHGIFGWHIAGGRLEDAAELDPGSIRWIRAQSHGTGYVEAPRPDLGVSLAVSTQYDRKQQLPQFDGRNYRSGWTNSMERSGQIVGAASKGHGKGVAIEFWNEPYLELGRFLEKELSKNTPPEGVKDGDPFTSGGRTFESLVWKKSPGDPERWSVVDPTRFTYWSARQMGILYTEAFRVFAAAARAENPDITLIGSYGFRWQEDDWESWKLLHKPLIDGAIEYLDGLGDHIYQGHPDGMAAAYEVAQAYVDRKHNKRIKFYNTEANDLWDAPARGNAAASGQEGAFVDRRRAVYNTRAILHAAMTVPDKLEARAIHALWSGATDERLKPGEALVDSRGGTEFRVTKSEWLDQVTLGDEALTPAAGKALFAVTLEAKETSGKRALSVFPADAVLREAGKGGSTWSPRADSSDRVDNKGRREFRVEKNGSGELVLLFETPADRKDAELHVKLSPKSSRVFAVNGPFPPFMVAPWTRIGIRKGEYLAMKFLTGLRGRLMEASSSAPDVWTVSSLDSAKRHLAVYVFNDSAQTRAVQLSVAAPAGTSFQSAEYRALNHNDTGEVTLDTRSLAVDPALFAETLQLPPAHAVAYLLRIEGPLPDRAQRIRTQVYAGDPAREDAGVLIPVAPGEQVTLPISLDDALVAAADKAVLRLVLERVRPGDGQVTVAGQTHTLPAALSPNNAPYLREIVLDPASLRGLSQISFAGTPAEEGGNGYLLGMASIVLEQNP